MESIKPRSENRSAVLILRLLKGRYSDCAVEMGIILECRMSACDAVAGSQHWHLAAEVRCHSMGSECLLLAMNGPDSS